MTDEIRDRITRLEVRQDGFDTQLQGVRTDVHQTEIRLRTEHATALQLTEARITSHLGQQDEAISQQGTKIDEMHVIEVERAAREKATLEAEQKAKAAAEARRTRRGDAMKITGAVVGTPTALIGLFTAGKAIAGPLLHLLAHLFLR